MSGWTVPTFLDAMKVKLEADSTLLALDPAVQVYTAEPSLQITGSDVIVLGYSGEDDDDESPPLGNASRDERQNINCYVMVVRPGAGETTAKAARDRAATIIGIVDSILRTDPPPVGQNRYAMRIGSRRFQQYPSEVGGSSTPVRVSVVDFNINYRARTSA
jgi:hypothetical protein